MHRVKQHPRRKNPMLRMGIMQKRYPLLFSVLNVCMIYSLKKELMSSTCPREGLNWGRIYRKYLRWPRTHKSLRHLRYLLLINHIDLRIILITNLDQGASKMLESSLQVEHKTFRTKRQGRIIERRWGTNSTLWTGLLIIQLPYLLGWQVKSVWDLVSQATPLCSPLNKISKRNHMHSTGSTLHWTSWALWSIKTWGRCLRKRSTKQLNS